MNKYLILLASSVLTFQSGWGQTFLNSYSIANVNTIAQSICIKDSFIFVAGEVDDTVVHGYIASYLAKFDLSGNMISDTILRNNRFAFFYLASDQNTLINTSDGGMAAVGWVVDTTSLANTYVLFSKFDSVGNLLFYKTFDFNFTYREIFSYGLIELNNSYYLIGQISLKDYYCAPYIARLDLQGNEIFAQSYSSLPDMYGTQASICDLSDSTLLVSVGRDDGNTNAWQEVLKTCFLTVDTSGNLIGQSCTSDINTWAYYHVAAVWGGDYLSAGSYYQNRDQNLDYDFLTYLVKWDKNSNILWTVKAGALGYFNNFSDFKQDQNNNIFLCGTEGNDSLPTVLGCLAKVDSNGNLIWYRRYEVPTDMNPDESTNSLNNLALLPNGDIVAIGTWQLTVATPAGISQLGWILKVDSNGCMDDDNCGIIESINEVTQGSVNPKAQSITVYPNPSNGVFIVNELINLPPFTYIDVFDVMGRKLLTQLLFGKINLLNLSGMPMGIYVYKVRNGLNEIGCGKLAIVR